MEPVLIEGDSTWVLLAVLLGAVAVGQVAERTAIGGRLSGAVVTMAVTFVLSNLGIVPVRAQLYELIWSYVVPLAIPLLLLRADLRKIFRDTGPTLALYALGAAATVVGSVVAFFVIDVGPDAWRLAGIFCATYIGGSMNFVAVSEALAFESGDLLTAAVAADSVVAILYYGVLFSLPSIPFVRRMFPEERGRPLSPTALPATVATPSQHHLALGLGIAAATCAIGHGMTAAFGKEHLAILAITAITVTLATVFPRPLAQITGAQDLGMFLMQCFFAVIGASAHVGAVLRAGPMLFAFAAVILATHLALILLFARAIGGRLPEILVASNANVGGPTTAAAMATACRWPQLVIPAIMCGTLGYAVANFIGVALARLLAPSV